MLVFINNNDPRFCYQNKEKVLFFLKHSWKNANMNKKR